MPSGAFRTTLPRVVWTVPMSKLLLWLSSETVLTWTSPPALIDSGPLFPSTVTWTWPPVVGPATIWGVAPKMAAASADVTDPSVEVRRIVPPSGLVMLPESMMSWTLLTWICGVATPLTNRMSIG